MQKKWKTIIVPTTNEMPQEPTSELVNSPLSCPYIAHISNNFGRSSSLLSCRRATGEQMIPLNSALKSMNAHNDQRSSPDLTCMLLHTKGLTRAWSRILVWWSNTQTRDTPRQLYATLDGIHYLWKIFYRYKIKTCEMIEISHAVEDHKDTAAKLKLPNNQTGNCPFGAPVWQIIPPVSEL